jgi:diadenosine tetraphosphatase ApaH/serine/threonine PP2A family protein phosphatase
MKLALLADVHANMPALEACLQHARAAGASRYAILGDLVGYGPHPVEVVERIRELEYEGALVLRGNHDTLNVNPVLTGASWADMTAAWTHRQLDDAQREWLAQRPLTATLGNVQLAERSLQAASADPEVRYVFGGHVHHQSLYYRGAGRGLMRFVPRAGVAIPVPPHRHWLATVGSAGQPRDGDPRAGYALLDQERHLLTFHRLAYDHDSVADDIVRAGLPAVLANRIETGQ